MPDRDKQIRKRANILSWVGSLFIVTSTLLIAVLTDQRTAGTYVFVLVTLTCIGFCIAYSRSRWRSTASGRSLMYVVGAFGLVGLVVCSSLFFGTDYYGRDQIRMVAYLAVVVSLFNELLTMLSYQWQSKVDLRKRSDNEHEG